MAQYAILVYQLAPADPADLTQEQRAAHDRHAAEVDTLGATMTLGFVLAPTTTATSISADTVTDGPFLDTKEVVAGFYVVEAPDLDAALAVAHRNPATQQGGAVEVRPVLDSYVRPPAAA